MKINKNKTKLILMLAFGIVSLASFVMLCFNLQVTEIVAVASALISLSGGGLVSVIVSWVIEVENARKDERERELIKVNILLPAYNTLIGMIYNFSRLCGIAAPDTEYNEKKNWAGWLELLIINVAEPLDSELQTKCIRSLHATVNNMQNRVNEIRSNRINLLLSDMLRNEEYYALCELGFLCGKIKAAAEALDVGALINELTYLSEHGADIFDKIGCELDLNAVEYDTNEFIDFMRKTDGKTYIKAV